MRRAGGLLVLALVLAGCAHDGVVHIKDAVTVKDVPACLSYPTEIAGTTYWVLEEDKVADWERTHQDPYGGTPQPQASAAWTSELDALGYLYRYDDGSALFISASGNRIWFNDEEREFGAMC